MLFVFRLDNLLLHYTDAGTNDAGSADAATRLTDILPQLVVDDLLKQLSAPGFSGFERKMPLYWKGMKRCGMFRVNRKLIDGFDCVEVSGEWLGESVLSTHSVSDNPLLVSEKTLATIIELAVDGVVIIDQQGMVQGFNRAAEKMFGYNACEVLGGNVSVLAPEPHRSKHDEYMQRYLNTRIPHIIGIGRQVDAQRRDGSLFPVDLAVGEVRLESGSLFTGFIRDLSESRKLESERNSFFLMSLDLFCILGFDGRFRRVNPQWQDVMGYAPGELEGSELAALIHPDDVGESGQLLTDILGVRNVVGRVMRLRKRNGEYLWMLWNSSIDLANNAVYGVSRDITEQRRILEELQSAKLEAERSSAAKSVFIAKMNHELRTPLNSIIGFSRHLQRHAEQFTPKEMLFLERISRNGESLLQLINTILDYSRNESGFSELHLSRVKVPDMIEEVIDLMQVLIEEKGVEIELQLPAECCEIESDQVKLRQILQNLIDNAVKFSDRSKVVIALTVDQNNLPEKVAITDSGPGISPDQLEVIFEAFQQGDNSLARRYGGAGLGLAIARSFADLLGIEIRVASTLGKGSTFTLHLRKSEV
ncbi:MAG: Sensor histidine kinase [Candidatus Rifleibacterium amylolyticum]|nr:MAG: Sensor histidine kinase [Candidatus Rifleibacterium amylolyticum]NLF97118.1 PAS domain S-box protein [Candidatus Riflebacteria bacterium]